MNLKDTMQFYTRTSTLLSLEKMIIEGIWQIELNKLKKKEKRLEKLQNLKRKILQVNF